MPQQLQHIALKAVSCIEVSSIKNKGENIEPVRGLIRSCGSAIKLSCREPLSVIKNMRFVLDKLNEKMLN